MIKPSIGRVVWFTPSGASSSSQPLAAIIAYVHSDTMVNLAVFDYNGNSRGETSVTLHQPENERPSSHYCEWMPYQVGQAAKTESLEKQLSEKN